MKRNLRQLAIEAGLVKPAAPAEPEPAPMTRARLTAQRRQALYRAACEMQKRPGWTAAGSGLAARMKDAEYQARLRKARRINNA